MSTVRWSGLALASLLALSAPVRAVPDDTPDLPRPAVVVQIKPLDDWYSATRQVVTLGGKLANRMQGLGGPAVPVRDEKVAVEDALRQVDQTLTKAFGGDWRKAIDGKRPILLAGYPNPKVEESTALALVPVADERAFLALFEHWKIKLDATDSVYSFEVPESKVRVFFRFSKRYAYISPMHRSALDPAKLPAPTDLLMPGETAGVCVKAALGRLPDSFKQLALGQFDKWGDEAKVKQPWKQADEHALEQKWAARLLAGLRSVVSEGDAVTVRLFYDRKVNEYTADVELTGKAGSKLAAAIAAHKTGLSPLAAVRQPDLAGFAAFNVPVAPEFRELIFWELNDGAKREPAEVRLGVEQLTKLLRPTLEAGNLDAAAALRGPSKAKRYMLFGGVSLKDAAAVEKAGRLAVKLIPEAQRKLLELDAEKVGGVAVHRYHLEKEPRLLPQVKAIFGDGPVYFAFADGAVLAAYGEEALPQLKAMLKAPAGPLPALAVEMSAVRLGPLVAHIDAQAAKQFESVIGKDIDRVRWAFATAEGGKSLRLRVSQTIWYPAAMGGMYFMVARAFAEVPMPVPPAKP